MGEGERKISLSLPLSPQETQQKVTRRDCERKTLLIPHYLLLSLVRPALLCRDRRDKVETKVRVIYGKPERGSRKGEADMF